VEVMLLTQEIYDVSKRLEKASKALYQIAEDKAESEMIYRMRLTQEILILREQGMSVGLINDVARGNVADLLFQRDASEAKFKAAIESLGALQSQLSALQSILKIQQEV
jgi:tRNA G10  N-methylase Trm11